MPVLVLFAEAGRETDRQWRWKSATAVRREEREGIEGYRIAPSLPADYSPSAAWRREIRRGGRSPRCEAAAGINACNLLTSHQEELEWGKNRFGILSL